MRRATAICALAAALGGAGCTSSTGGTGVGLPAEPTATATARDVPAAQLLPSAADWGHPNAHSEVPGENGEDYLTFCLDRLAGKRPLSTVVPARTDVGSRGWVDDGAAYLYTHVYVFSDPAVAEAFAAQVQAQADGCPAVSTDEAGVAGQPRTYRVENRFSAYQRGQFTGSRDELTVTRIAPPPEAARTTHQVIAQDGAVVVFLDSSSTESIDQALDAIGSRLS